MSDVQSNTSSSITMAVNPVSQPYNRSFRRVVWATLVFVSIIFCFWLFYRFYHVVFTLFIAIVIGTVIRPVVNWLYQRGLARIAGVILVYLLLLILLTGFLWLLFPLIFEQSSTLAREVPGYYQNLHAGLANNPNQLLMRLGQLLPAGLPTLNPGLLPQTGQEMVASAGQVLGYAVSAAQVIFRTIVLLALALSWTLDGPRIIKTFLLLVPQDRRESIGELISAMESKVGFYLAGQGILCLVI